MWRAYAANGTGFALEIATPQLARLQLTGTPVNSGVVRVEYNEERQKACARRFVAAALEVLEQPAATAWSDTDKRLLAVLSACRW
jgi:hypothetical protein